MNLLLFSTDDLASMNIFENVMNTGQYEKIGAFEDYPAYAGEKYYLLTIKKDKVYANFIDEKIKKTANINFDTIIVASMHRSSTNTKSLTVHPVGNYADAELGGLNRVLAPTDPGLMSQALRILKEHSIPDYSVTLETTHHGPAMNSKLFFIEIGSSEPEWKDPEAGAVIANTLITLDLPKNPAFIGFGGGHYMSRVTDLVLKQNFDIGHMAAKYELDYLDEDLIAQMLSNSNMAERAYVHKKGMTADQYRKVLNLLASKNVKLIDF